MFIHCLILIASFFSVALNANPFGEEKFYRHSCYKTDKFKNISRWDDMNRNMNLKLVYQSSEVTCDGITSQNPKQWFLNDDNTLLNVTSILFRNSNISHLSYELFDKFPSLIELYLNSSNVEFMDPSAFRTLKHLTELHLENNSITKIGRGVLNVLSNLNELYLSHNRISEIEELAFSGLIELSVLDVSFNKLNHILPNIFYKLDSLREVDLSHNSFVQFHIEGSPQIQIFKISSNQLNQFNFSVFSSDMIADTRIDILDLSNNQLLSIGNIEPHLTYLNLSFNRLYSLTDDELFNSSHNLETLDLGDNQIQNISANVFIELRLLKHLLLQNNVIDEIPIGCFRNLNELTILNLSGNLLAELDFGTFTGLSSLKYLDLSRNKLTVLHESSLHLLKNLRILNITGNLLTAIDPHNLMDISKNLKVVSLHNNLWSCNEISSAIKVLETRIIVEEGPNKQDRNHHGIACSNVPVNPSGTVSRINENAKISSEMPDFLSGIRKYFNDDFLKSEFYKYFENLRKFNVFENLTKNLENSFTVTDNQFQNTKLYKFFNSEIPKTSPIKQLLEEINNSVKSINNTRIIYTNVTFQNNLRENNPADSNILKLISSLDIKQNVDKYLDDIFNNSKFSSLLNSLKSLNFSSERFDEPVNEKLPARFSAYTSTNDTNNEPVGVREIIKYLDKIETQLKITSEKYADVNNNAFFSIIIVILLALMALIFFKRTSNNKIRFLKRSSKVEAIPNDISLSSSRTQIV